MSANVPANALAIALGVALGVLATLAAVLPLLCAAIDQRDAARTALTIAKRRNAQQADEITQQALYIARSHVGTPARCQRDGVGVPGARTARTSVAAI